MQLRRWEAQGESSSALDRPQQQGRRIRHVFYGSVVHASNDRPNVRSGFRLIARRCLYQMHVW